MNQLGRVIKSHIIKRLNLQVEQWGVSMLIRPGLAKLPDDLEPVYENLLASLRATVVVEQQKPLRLDMPDDWWEHFKERWFPAWALARWPVRKKVIELPMKTIYPTLQTQIPPALVGPVFTIVVQGEPKATVWTESGKVMDYRAEMTEEVAMRRLDEAGAPRCQCCGKLLRPAKWHRLD